MTRPMEPSATVAVASFARRTLDGRSVFRRTGAGSRRGVEGESVAGRRGGALGVLKLDRARSLVAVSHDGELAVALRERLPRELIVVRDARPEDCAAIVSACRPWPWMVCGDVDALDPTLLRRVCRHPVLVAWLRTPPAGLPAHAQCWDRFSGLASAVSGMLSTSVAGMRLAPGLGVTMPDGSFAPSAALEALVALHPSGFAVPLRCFRAATAALASRGLSMSPQRDGEGFVRLAEAAA